jgi:hypothetical protein
MPTAEIKTVLRPLTAAHKQRTVDALDETQRKIDKEMAYSEDLRKHDEVARLEAHRDYLHATLAPGYLHAYPDFS